MESMAAAYEIKPGRDGDGDAVFHRRVKSPVAHRRDEELFRIGIGSAPNVQIHGNTILAGLERHGYSCKFGLRGVGRQIDMAECRSGCTFGRLEIRPLQVATQSIPSEIGSTAGS